MVFKHFYFATTRTNIPWAMRLSWLENTYSPPLLSAGDFDLKVDQSQTDLGFDVRLGIISRCVLARLQVSVCSGCDLFDPG